MAQPLRDLSKVLEQVLLGEFNPDARPSPRGFAAGLELVQRGF